MSTTPATRILYMEDDLGVARLFKRKLSRLGYDITLAEDGKQGLELLSNQRFDLVAVDQEMPVMNGLDVIRALTQEAGAPPVIMVTGGGDEEIAVKALKLGARDYIVKDGEGGFLELMPAVIEQTFKNLALEEAKRKAEADLRDSEERYRSLVELSPDAIIVLHARRIDFINKAGAKLLGARDPDDLVGKPANSFVHHDFQQFFINALKPLLEHVTPSKVEKFESEIVHLNGDIISVEVLASFIRFKGRPSIQLVARDVTARKKAETAIYQMNEELEHIVRERTIQVEDLHTEMDKARLSGHEKANDVLHNVKNVLNSLIIGTSMMGDILSKSKVNRVQKVAQLLQENQSKLGTFLTEGEKGRLLPDFLMALASHLGREREMIVEELNGLTRNLEHIKVSIQLQLKSARVGHSGEIFNLREAVEEALDINRDAIERLPIQVKREFHTTPDINFNKHEVLQILVNLISNAIKAMEEYESDSMVLTLCIRTDDNYVCCDVTDSGIGISQDNLSKLFAYGFTTRKTGHGFGLHSCMALANEMEGKLAASSDGPGKGATFTLCLPFKN